MTVKTMALALAISLTPLAGVAASDLTQMTDYTIAYGGLAVASLSFTTQLSGESFSVKGDLHPVGVLSIFTDIKALTEAKGRVAENRFVPERYTLDYRSAKDKRIYDVAFAEGAVTRHTITPEPASRPDNWVALSDDDLKAAIDPVTGLILPGTATSCAGTRPIFDGEARMDLILTPIAPRSYSFDGFKGETLSCRVQYVPKSGYRKGRFEIDFMSKVKGIEVTFGKSGAIDVWAPIYAKIPSPIGMITVAATRIAH